MSHIPDVELIARYARLSEEQKIQVAAILGLASPGASPGASPNPSGVSTSGSEEARRLIDRVGLFDVLSEEERSLLAGRLAEVGFGPGAFMVQEGTQDASLYLISDGEAEVRVTLEGSNVTRPVARLGAGDVFGEMALLTGEPRRASVISATTVRCFRLDREGFEDLVRSRPALVDALAAVLARRMAELQSIRRESASLLESLPELERNALIGLMREVAFAPSESIVEQGAKESWMGILIGGQAEVRIEHEGSGRSRQVAVLKSGDHFGEMGMLSGQTRTATIVARTRVDCYVLEREAFDRWVAEFPQAAARLRSSVAERTAELRRVRDGFASDLQQQQIRTTQNRLKRRIRRLFSLDRPPGVASRLLASARPRRATGRLLFEFPGLSGDDRPLHNLYVELWHRDVIDVFLGCATTARDGTFEIWYDPSDFGGRVHLELRGFEVEHTYSPTGDLQLTNRLCFTFPGDRSATHDVYTFGDLRVPYWEYDPSQPVPRVLIPEQGEPPQSYAPGRSMVMLKVLARVEMTKQKHLLEHRLSGGTRPSLEKIQRDYPENLTIRLERERPGYTRSDEYFGERMLNGMSASVFDRDETDPRRVFLYHHWNSYEQDGVHALPNVDMRFEIRDERLYPVQISLHLRTAGATEPNAHTERLTLTPADGDRWTQAKRIARVSAAMVAQLDNHLISTHLNTEQYAVAAYRNLRKNPLRYLLFPHLKEVVLINHLGNEFLLGPRGYFVTDSALTENGLQQRIGQVMGTLDWKNWRPIQPICATHTYAKAANLFWDALSEYVDEFFEQHAAEIAEHWYEVHLFSQDLVAHSVPGFLCRYLTSTVVNGPPEGHAWFTTDQRMDLNLPRFQVDGVPRAVQPVTQSSVPLTSDIENMKQVCRYVIYQSTFKHTWANARQYDDGGEILYNGLGLRYGPDGLFVPESDHRVAPPPDRATQLLWILFMLSRSVYGLIMRNEDRDIHPAFVEALEKRRADFEALGFDIETIQSRANI